MQSVHRPGRQVWSRLPEARYEDHYADSKSLERHGGVRDENAEMSNARCAC